MSNEIRELAWKVLEAFDKPTPLDLNTFEYEVEFRGAAFNLLFAAKAITKEPKQITDKAK